MTNEELQKKIEKLDALADKNYMNYQDSGESRYYRAYNNYNEQADIYRLALNANDEHLKYIHLNAAVHDALREYQKTEYQSTPEAYETMRKAFANLKSYMNMR